MTTLEIARIADARHGARGWVAKCPAHEDRRPSLSICEGRQGRTLVRCFAGCEPAAITHALGLKLADLFADKWNPDRGAQTRRLSAAEVEEALNGELHRIVASESERLGFGIATLARHRNKARSIIERRLSVRLKREPSRWYEVEPHCVDPVWTACVDQAMHLVAARGNLAFRTLRAAIEDLPKAQERIFRLARKLQRSSAGVAA